MTPRSRKPVLLVSGTNINNLPSLQTQCNMEDVEEDTEDSKKILEESIEHNNSRSSLTSTFREYLCSRSILTRNSSKNQSFCSHSDDFITTDEVNNLTGSKLSESLLYCLNGNDPSAYESKIQDEEMEQDESEEKELVLKPKQFDENGKPTVFETSF